MRDARPAACREMGVEPLTLSVVKLDARHRVKLCYTADLVERRPYGTVLTAVWALRPATSAARASSPGTASPSTTTPIAGSTSRKSPVPPTGEGWYCDIAEPAVIEQDLVSLVDLELDVWVSAEGEAMVLDEDEFAESPLLSAAQRTGARHGLLALFQILKERQGVCAALR